MVGHREIEMYARRKGFSVTAGELSRVLDNFDGYIELLDLDRFERLDRRAVSSYGHERESGRQPKPGEDPYNAVIRYCDIKGANRGLLKGMKIGIKDNIAVAGVPMTKGKMSRIVPVPSEDAVAVERILRAGGNIIAKTNVELGASDFGRTLNPVNTLFYAGASSSGSAAAVAAGIVDAALGTDAGGSIRHPASFCGIVGMKPTYGLVPSYGIQYGSQRLTQIGPMTANVKDNATILEVISGKDWRDPYTISTPTRSEPYNEAAKAGVNNLRIGVVSESVESSDCKPSILDVFEGSLESLKQLGGHTKVVSIPLWKESTAIWSLTYLYERLTEKIGYIEHFGQGRVDAKLQADLAEQLWQNDHELTDNRSCEIVCRYVWESYLGAHFGHSQNLRLELTSQVDNVLNEVDVLITPTHPKGPGKVTRPNRSDRSHNDKKVAVLESATIANLTGNPALTVPSGADDNDLPIGIQIIGRKFDECSVYRVGFAIESIAHSEPIGT